MILSHAFFFIVYILRSIIFFFQCNMGSSGWGFKVDAAWRGIGSAVVFLWSLYMWLLGIVRVKGPVPVAVRQGVKC